MIVSTKMTIGQRRDWWTIRRPGAERFMAGRFFQCFCGGIVLCKYRGRFYCYQCGRLVKRAEVFRPRKRK